MATKSNVRIEFDKSSIEGVATLNDKQMAQYGRQSVRLRTDLVYVAMPQWVHVEKLAVPVNGYDKSNRIFVIGVDEHGIAQQALSLSVNGLQTRHFGAVKDNPQLKIQAVKNDDGLWRIKPGTDQFSVFEVGALPLATTADKKAYVTRPFAFKVAGRTNCYTISFTKVGDKYDIDHYTEDNETYVKLGSYTYNRYIECLDIPEVDWSIIGDEFTKDLPKK